MPRGYWMSKEWSSRPLLQTAQARLIAGNGGAHPLAAVHVPDRREGIRQERRSPRPPYQDHHGRSHRSSGEMWCQAAFCWHLAHLAGHVWPQWRQCHRPSLVMFRALFLFDIYSSKWRGTKNCSPTMLQPVWVERVPGYPIQTDPKILS